MSHTVVTGWLFEFTIFHILNVSSNPSQFAQGSLGKMNKICMKGVTEGGGKRGVGCREELSWITCFIKKNG